MKEEKATAKSGSGRQYMVELWWSLFFFSVYCGRVFHSSSLLGLMGVGGGGELFCMCGCAVAWWAAGNTTTPPWLPQGRAAHAGHPVRPPQNGPASQGWHALHLTKRGGGQKVPSLLVASVFFLFSSFSSCSIYHIIYVENSDDITCCVV